jgi:hypothetical protein
VTPAASVAIAPTSVSIRFMSLRCLNRQQCSSF